MSYKSCLLNGMFRHAGDKNVRTERHGVFTVRRIVDETIGDLKQHPCPLPEETIRGWTSLLVEGLGFTPDEAARYLAGDRTAIEAVAKRRMKKDTGEDLGETRSDVLGTGR